MTTLLRMRLAMVANRLRTMGIAGALKLSAVAVLILGFLLGEGGLIYLLIASLRDKEDLAPVFVLALVGRLLSLVFLLCLSMLFFSNVTASIATVYLSRDLDLLLSTPLPPSRVFLLKFAETLLNSSYMVVLFVTPILVATGLAFQAGPLFYLQVPLTLMLFILPPAAAGILLTMVLMRSLPAKRTQQALTAAGVLLGVSFVTGVRLLSPERLLRPTTTEDFQAILEALTFKAAPYLPSTWAGEMQLSVLTGAWDLAWRRLLPLAALAFGSVALTYAASTRLYFRGVTTSHEGGRRRAGGELRLDRPLGPAGREARLFFRDPAQWSQLLLLVALVVVYVFNITALPQDLLVVGVFVTVRDVVAWINVGLAGFVLAAVGMRFVLPSISAEGGAIWTIAASPLPRRRYVLRKLAFYLPPLVAFSLVLVALSGRALHVDAFVHVLSLATTVLVTSTLVILAVGLGAALPSFKLENPAQFVLTGGGVLYGVLSLFYVFAVVALEARPFFWHLLGAAGRMEPGSRAVWPYYAAIVALSVAVSAGSLWWGMRRFEKLEV